MTGEYPHRQPREDSLAYWERVARLADQDADYQKQRKGASS